jgi:hydroxymethylpyrimidine pyrophosphatase-like HAD family hydrolase
MGQAPSEVREAANTSTDSDVNDGVASFLAQL